jgi:hypothetical protein
MSFGEKIIMDGSRLCNTGAGKYVYHDLIIKSGLNGWFIGTLYMPDILLQGMLMYGCRYQINISINVPLPFMGGLSEGLYLIIFVFAGEGLPVFISTQSIISSGETGTV